jgi:hypothetical protein
VLVGALVAARPARAQSQNTEIASGTLNLVLANKNGFVIAADSRMSSVTPFFCRGQSQTHCDDSQKLFRTGPKSALVIAGFAVGGNNSPLDLAIASVLRKRFGNGLESDIHVPDIVNGLANQLEMALENISEVAGPNNPPSPLWVTFARVNENHIPVLRQYVFTGSWKLMSIRTTVRTELGTAQSEKLFTNILIRVKCPCCASRQSQ